MRKEMERRSRVCMGPLIYKDVLTGRVSGAKQCLQSLGYNIA